MRERGFTYLGVLALLMVAGIVMTGAARSWSTTTKREKEAELLFRGDQIRRAIASYAAAGGGTGAGRYPGRLEDLLRDNRTPGMTRHLRRIFPDPLAPDGQWGMIRDNRGGIRGVFSKSDGTPLKRDRFPREYSKFKDAARYSDWKFAHNPPRAAGSPAAQGVQSAGGTEAGG
jgi:type II secretory pathway pseudopilin PulG